jgi:hypothetical protein
MRTNRRNLEANYYGMHFRLLSMSDTSLNLTQDFTLFRDCLGSYNRTHQGCFRQVTVVTVKS